MASASIRTRRRADGSTAYAVLYQIDGTQTSATFDDEQAAQDFRNAIKTLGPQRAMLAWGIAPTTTLAKKISGPTVAEWVDKHIDALSGVARSTLYDYRAYLRNDITPALGAIPLALLAPADVAAWVEAMAKAGSSGKTIQNNHGFLASALNTAVAAGHIPANPAAGTRLPRTERPEMIFLTQEEFRQLRTGFTDRWLPLLDFMVASGARFGEIAALRPSDVDRQRGTVHIGRAWKRTYVKGDGYELGAPKTKKSVRTISVAPAILDGMDYSREYLFVNSRGGPLRVAGWRANVWYPSVDRAQKKEEGLKKAPRIHDMRHTCASWMIAAGVPLPVIQRHLGHESIATTVNLYGHLDRKESDAAAAVMAAALARP